MASICYYSPILHWDMFFNNFKWNLFECSVFTQSTRVRNSSILFSLHSDIEFLSQFVILFNFSICLDSFSIHYCKPKALITDECKTGKKFIDALFPVIEMNAQIDCIYRFTTYNTNGSPDSIHWTVQLETTFWWK